ncbi:MAG: tRNA uridine(34) 5-carboxymethylaminomethyl modification radical SAM/GNAT enzyme Elp3 [Candidatus Diapherotrites archaeon]|nr:tRNA uridine(34) 5-carboxymethylaminomethyl modification radical SAM/GNAT enzyme Elp3 [Candidatus Diapherotrites archaeon]
MQKQNKDSGAVKHHVLPTETAVEKQDKIRRIAQTIVEAIGSGQIQNKRQLNRLKMDLCHELNLTEMPSDPDILAYTGKNFKQLSKILGIKPVRTLSGVTPVAIMTKPINCQHGTCIYCPGGLNSFFGDIPKSYTGNEPASMRAILNDYDAYLQTINRLTQYVSTGHTADKVELIVMGGTFPSFPKGYQEEFITGSFKAMNDFGEKFYNSETQEIDFEKFSEYFNLPLNEHDPKVRTEIKNKLLSEKGILNLEHEHQRNEHAKIRCVTLCIETKPDWCKQVHLDQMLKLGCTRVEIGVQSLQDKILKYTNRGHTIQDTMEAVQLSKDSFLKTVFHIMPGQPLSNRTQDIEMFQELFANPNYRPDGLKIYPCMVMPGTPLQKLWERGEFTPLETEAAAEIIAEGKKYIQKYCRVHRVQRDIPVKLASTGINKNNLRQLVEEELKNKKIVCQCIRCREAGISSYKQGIESGLENAEIIIEKYDSSQGLEYFISLENTQNNLLFGFIRLRLPSQPFRPEITPKTAGIRELHVFGTTVPLDTQLLGKQVMQHKGWGKKLLETAEKIASEELDCKKLLVIAGVGAREYYYKLGYQKDGIYVGKKLD